MKGSIRQRSKGTWQLRYDAPPDGTGRRRFVSKTFKGNKKDAERALRELLATIENGGYVASDKETVAQFMVRWLETYAATNTNRKTQQGYRGLIDRYLTPYLGNIKLQDLTARRIQALYADMHSRGLGAPSIVATHRVLKEALGHAVRWSVITRNVADAATPPRIERKTMPMWDVAEINRFLDATAKWFNTEKGYGFVTRGEGTPDVFVHVKALRRVGIEDLLPGQSLRVRVGQGPKGPQVAEIEIL